MHTFITGGTGLIGSGLVRSLLKQGDSVTVYTRNAALARQKFGPSVNCCTDLNNVKSFDGFDAVVNLAGEPIAPGRWTADKKDRIAQSRWNITEQLVSRIKAADKPPSVFLSGSAVGYYGNQGRAIVTEDSYAQPSFLQSVCQKWEAQAFKAVSEKTRVVVSRTGIVMSATGGMLAKLLPVFKLGLGAPIGKGEQGLSWVHRQDMVDMLLFLLRNESAQGAFNLTSPHPLSNREFAQALAHTLRRPCLPAIPSWVIKLALGEASEMLLDGQYVVPKKMVDLGFTFAFPRIDAALQSILEHGDAF
ncbi:hypothetical protein AAG570_014159 [Ranatra chinensis]|uniref:TIGR01777 family protein n=1 Tax=Ranatra chinensis TaxID=642074 RepID=A0ABD0XTN7_9HEMI